MRLLDVLTAAIITSQPAIKKCSGHYGFISRFDVSPQVIERQVDQLWLMGVRDVSLRTPSQRLAATGLLHKRPPCSPDRCNFMTGWKITAGDTSRSAVPATAGSRRPLGGGVVPTGPTLGSGADRFGAILSGLLSTESGPGVGWRGPTCKLWDRSTGTWLAPRMRLCLAADRSSTPVLETISRSFRDAPPPSLQPILEVTKCTFGQQIRRGSIGSLQTDRQAWLGGATWG